MINSLYLILRFFEKIKHFKIYKKKNSATEIYINIAYNHKKRGRPTANDYF